MIRIICCLAVMIACATIATAENIHTEFVDYKEGETALRGYLAYDEAQTGRRPGVLIIHDWLGEGDYGHMRAEMIAKLGYVAFALDMYGKDVRPKDSSQAQQATGPFYNDPALMRRRANAGLDVLRNDPHVDAGKLVVMGYCFGGTCALELARGGADVIGVVTFHGGLKTKAPDDAKNIKGKVLVLTGADDPVAPPADVTAFEDQMRKAGVDYQVVSYGSAVHGFTKKGSAAYNEKADRRSWEAMRNFLSEVFR